MLPTWMYATGQDSLYVNLYAGSTVTVDNVAGTKVEIEQTTDYPWSGKVAIVVRPARRRSGLPSACGCPRGMSAGSIRASRRSRA